MSAPLLVKVLTQPALAPGLRLDEWDLLVRQGRRANLLGTLAHRLEPISGVPPPAKAHLQSAGLLAQRQHVAMRWEVDCIQQALAATGVPTLLMKGTAYLMADLPVAQGRLFGDVDIIVPKDRLGKVEAALMAHGWEGSHTDDYDQRYYREWMHEIPPMQHRRRGSVIDVHHAVLPETARIRADSTAMIEAAVPVLGHERLFTFQPLDMVLHSATHLFHEGEFDNGLRDLVDLDGLLRHFGAAPGFWDELPERAWRLGLQRPIYHALRYAQALLDTPVPPSVHQAMTEAAPSPATQRVLDACYAHALRPLHESCDDGFSALGRGLLYVRSHWLRMPVQLLVPHLLRKALLRPAVDEKDGDDDDPMALRPTGQALNPGAPR